MKRKEAKEFRKQVTVEMKRMDAASKAEENRSGQIIATSHDLTPNGGLVWFSKGNPVISGKSRLVKHYNLARIFPCHTELQQLPSSWLKRMINHDSTILP